MEIPATMLYQLTDYINNHIDTLPFIYLIILSFDK